MINDPIVEEIRIFRAAHAAKYGNDLDHIFLAIKKSEKQHAHEISKPRSQMRITRRKNLTIPCSRASKALGYVASYDVVNESSSKDGRFC